MSLEIRDSERLQGIRLKHLVDRTHTLTIVQDVFIPAHANLHIWLEASSKQFAPRNRFTETVKRVDFKRLAKRTHAHVYAHPADDLLPAFASTGPVTDRFCQRLT